MAGYYIQLKSPGVYYVQSLLYRYEFDFAVMHYVKPRFMYYPDEEDLDAWYNDLSREDRKKITRVLL